MNNKDRDKWKLIMKFKNSMIPPCEVCRLRGIDNCEKAVNSWVVYEEFLYQACGNKENCKEFNNFRDKLYKIQMHYAEHGIII